MFKLSPIALLKSYKVLLILTTLLLVAAVSYLVIGILFVIDGTNTVLRQEEEPAQEVTFFDLEALEFVKPKLGNQ